jgi:hypothetical protein
MAKDNTPTIHELRKAGYKVRVIHSFSEDEQRVTKIEITTPEGTSAWGASYCHVKDNYDRKLGNKIAVGRAMKALHNNIMDVTFKKLNIFFGV